MDCVYRRLIAKGWASVEEPRYDPEFCRAIVRKEEKEAMLVWSAHASESRGFTIRFVASATEASRAEILRLVSSGVPEDRVI